MARKTEDQPQILVKETQSSLLQLASREVDISVEAFPKDLVIKVEVSFKIILKIVVCMDSRTIFYATTVIVFANLQLY